MYADVAVQAVTFALPHLRIPFGLEQTTFHQ